MPSPRRGRSLSGGDKLTAEFTSGQLVIGIVCALFFCVVCFMLGILVGKTDPSLQAVTQDSPPAATTPPAPAATATTKPAGGAVGTQQSPRTDGLRPHSTQQAKPTELAPLPSASASGGPVRVARETPATETTRTRIDTPAAPAQQAPAAATTPATPAPPAATPASEPTQTAAATPSTMPATPTPATPTAPTPAAPAAPTTPAAPVAITPVVPADPVLAPATPTAAPTTQSAASSARGGAFGVQIASLGGADRQAKANAFIQKFKQDTGLDAQAIPSEDGQLLRIVVGGYPNRQAADAACAELKKRPGLGDAFVRALP